MTVAEKRVFFIWVSAHFPHVDHAVTDEEMAARSAENRGEYRAVCGAVFLPAPDDRPPLRACPECGRSLRTQVPADQERLRAPRRDRARQTRVGWWGRLCRVVS
jgi:hypothetical protein